MSMASLEARIMVHRSETFRVDVDLSVEAGSTVALLGPNGAGKSTVVSAISGLLAIDRGTIALADQVLDDPSSGIFVPAEERHIGVVFQHHLLFPHLTVVDNVAFGLRARGAPRPDADVLAREWLDRMGVAALAASRPPQLSGGQAQRVALARALAIEPRALLLDEPMSALDVSGRAELRHSLAGHLDGFGGPRLLITHDPAEAFLLADDIYVIEDGEVTQTGSPDEIRLRPKTRYAADLAGANLIEGIAADGVVTAGQNQLHIADHAVSGPVLLTIHPTAISVHRNRPEGSPRNAWRTTIGRVENLGDRVRVGIGDPLPLTVEVTRDAVRALGLETRSEVWVAIKATEIGVEADQ